MKHQRRGWQQIPKIGEKSERERNFNIASKTACRGFKSFCPCHREKVRRCSPAGRLRAFSMPKSLHWTRSKDTGFPWQNPPTPPNIREYSNGYRPVHHQKSISQFQEKDGLVPCAEERRLSEKRNASFLFNLVVLPNIDDCLTVIDMRDKM